jgi:hypothetical protein
MENRLFRTNTENPITLNKDKMFVARKHKHLFIANQIITRPIHHLRYKNQRDSYPVASEYPYRIPFNYFVNSRRYKSRKHYRDLENPNSRSIENHCPSRQSEINVDGEPSEGSTSTNIPLPKPRKSRYKTVKDIDNWIALPEDLANKLDKKYLPFVPTKPLYSRSRKHYYPSGSPDWYKHLKEAYRQDQIRIAQENGCNLRKINANYFGTMVSKFKKRKNHVAQLTDFQNRFHNTYKSNPKQKKFNEDRINLHNQQNLLFKLGTGGYDSAETSDNTKEVELRPKKRADTMEPRVHPNVASSSKKKQKILLTGDDDHLEKEN